MKKILNFYSLLLTAAFVLLAAGLVVWSETSRTQADTSAPPTNLTATSTSPTQVNLTWSAPDMGTTSTSTLLGYNIIRNGSQLATSSVASFSDMGLSPNTSYNYNVSWFDSSGSTSPWSLTATVMTQAETPTSTPATSTVNSLAAPLNLTATATSDSQISLNWSAGIATNTSGTSSMLNYNVIRNGSQIATTSTTSYSDMGLSANTLYSYNVSVYDSSTTSPWSTTASATTMNTATGTPSAPTSTLDGLFNPGGSQSDIVGFLVLPKSVLNGTSAGSSSSSTMASPYTMQNGYPTLNGNYYDCNGNIDNDMAHHVTNVSDTDPAHHIGQNCPGGMPMPPSGSGQTMNTPWNNMNWSGVPFVVTGDGNWIIIPIYKSSFMSMFNALQALWH